MTVPYVHSGYDRIEGDNYQTVDSRCLASLLSAWSVPAVIWEQCSEQGSGLIYDLSVSKRRVISGGDAFEAPDTIVDAIITNPPYIRPLVDDIVRHGASMVRSGDILMAAYLLRANWDLAKCRADLLTAENHFAGCVRMRFRPWWSDERKAQPIHNYQWVIFDSRHSGEPVVRYSDGEAQI